MLKKEKVKIKSRGIKKYHTFKGVDNNLKEFIHSFHQPIVYFDPDVDGCIAGLLVCKLFGMLGIKFDWYINSNRSHDWSLPVEKVRGRDIFAVDFIITADKIKELVDGGCNIVSMDHHTNGSYFIESKGKNGNHGLVINNQYPFEEEDSRYLSGAGVVFESIVAMYSEFDTALNRALVGITLLSDVRDIENELAHYYLSELYTYKYEGYIKYLIDSVMGEIDYGFGLPKMDRDYVDYKFSPAINACLRFNREDEVVNFFLGRGELDLGYREVQKELTRSIVEKSKKISLPNLNITYFYEKDFMQYSDVLSNFVGLVASKGLDGERSSICYMISTGEGGKLFVKRASFRGHINGLDYQGALFELFQCLGHKSAFGIKGIVPSKETFKRANKLCSLVEEDSGYIRKVINVVNMSMFVNRNAYEIAEDNLYALSQNKTYIKYVGTDIQNKRSGANYKEYSVNGIPVKCFDLKKDFDNGLILPTLDRGLLTFYLE